MHGRTQEALNTGALIRTGCNHIAEACGQRFQSVSDIKFDYARACSWGRSLAIMVAGVGGLARDDGGGFVWQPCR